MAITVNPSKIIDTIRPMHAVNNGPVCSDWGVTGDDPRRRDNRVDYQAAGIPYARNHDAAFYGNYGGEHCVDISAIFPDFDKDPYDPASYDFICTDNYVQRIAAVGTETFYRLGTKIEHYVKKFNTLPPKDFHKWAVICEHIIRHYNEGWADGFQMNLQYWEIWNEPDLDPDDSDNKRTWGGTQAEFFDFYEIAAKHLKECFPDLKIGGPAITGNLDWAAEFLPEMHKRNVPMDFFSWHIYTADPKQVTERGNIVRKLMDENGYADAESILNEWNYIKGWQEELVYSYQMIVGIKGAAFTAACMAEGQNNGIDMMMYYDARPSLYNGLFDYITLKPLKGYYPFQMFNRLYKMERQVEISGLPEDIYGVSATDGKEAAVMLSYFTDEENMPEKTMEISLKGLAANGVAVYLLDEDHDCEKVSEVYADTLTLTMQSNTVIQLVTL